jgi:hypothetical protein
MPLKFKPGDAVRQVMPAPLSGTVTAAEIIDGEVAFRVDGVNADGDHVARYFTEAQIEAVTE